MISDAYIQERAHEITAYRDDRAGGLSALVLVLASIVVLGLGAGGIVVEEHSDLLAIGGSIVSLVAISFAARIVVHLEHHLHERGGEAERDERDHDRVE